MKQTQIPVKSQRFLLQDAQQENISFASYIHSLSQTRTHTEEGSVSYWRQHHGESGSIRLPFTLDCNPPHKHNFVHLSDKKKKKTRFPSPSRKIQLKLSWPFFFKILFSRPKNRNQLACSRETKPPSPLSSEHHTVCAWELWLCIKWALINLVALTQLALSLNLTDEAEKKRRLFPFSLPVLMNF